MQFRNFLLSSLDAADLQAILPGLGEISLSAGQVLFDVGAPAEVVYFPSSAVVSVVTVMNDGRSVESHTIGRESGVGLLNAASRLPLESRIFTQVAGAAFRLSAKALRNRLAESPALVELLLRHVHAASLQTQQFVACNVLHSAEQRLARWLLMTSDRTGTLRFLLTQEYMAVMTGVQRTTVSAIATSFRQSGLMRYSRGHVEILDHDGLQAVSCECARIAHGQFQALQLQNG